MPSKNSLFNDATVKRLVSGTQVTAGQKKFAKEWLNLIESGGLIKEKQGYLKFYDIILKGLLGYEGLEHEKDNVEFSYEKEGKSIVRIEAKGMDTPNLFTPQKRAKEESPVQQVWRYMNKFATPYGIVTNYKTFILFKYDVGNAKYFLFDFEDVKDNPDKLKEFIAIFSRESVDGGFVDKLYEKSVVEEREFTKEFYKLYHETRLMLIKEFESNDEKLMRSGSVHFAQLYLNRLMFAFFAEDTGKLERRIVEDRILKTLENIHLFSSNSSQISNVIVGLFRDLDKGSDFPLKIFGFNGGLFSHPIPPRIYFRDFRDEKFFKDEKQFSKLKEKELELNEKEKEIFEKYKNKISPLIKNILLMASFDFNSEVNVNILGHIFEQSISDIEDLKADKNSRRKKEGIYYTPEYITDYICRNTIIPYLSEKGNTAVPDLIKEYAENMDELENKFKSIKILDPACGSGAFLIKATDVLLEIFRAIQEFKQSEGEYEAKRGLKKKSNNKGQLVLTKWNEEDEAREIILNSIHGVDINEESVEITKLALFLKMARKNRKLTDLSNNIKQGNSLIDDESVAGELAFDWNTKFKDVLDNGGFDVIVGNPPYVNITKINKGELKSFENNYYSAKYGRYDLYVLFLELAINLVKENGLFGYIIPDKICYQKYGRNAREILLDKCSIKEIVNYSGYRVFEDAVVDNITLICEKTKNKKGLTKISRCIKNPQNLKSRKINQEFYEEMPDKSFRLSLDNEKFKIIKKIQDESVNLSEICYVSFGMQPGKLDKFVFNKIKNPEKLEIKKTFKRSLLEEETY